jgi:hypothetical protein
MKLPITLTLALISLSAAGCTRTTVDRDFKPRGPLSEAHEPINRAIIEGYRTQQVDNGIIRQRALYPYHFDQDTAVLNSLGMRAVHVLSHHFKTTSGTLSVRAGDAPDELYQARLEEVRRRMADAGVDLARITIADALPGGDGISSDQIVIINERLKESTSLSSKSDESQSTKPTAMESGSQSNSGGSN